MSTLLSGVAVAQDAKTVIANATKAMGYDKLNTIQYSGSGFEGTGAGQLQSLAAGWPKFTEKNYVRYIDYAAGTSQRTSLQSRPADPKTGMLPGGGGLDPGAEAANTSNIAANANWAAKTWINLSPPGFLTLASAGTFYLRAPTIRADWGTFVILAAAATVAQLFPVKSPRNAMYHTSVVFLVAAALLLPPELIVLIPLVQTVPEWLKERYPWPIEAFNISNYTLNALAAWGVADLVEHYGKNTITNSDARFAVSGIDLGLFCSTPSVALSRMIGQKAAL
jgi:hypothetical protein